MDRTEAERLVESHAPLAGHYARIAHWQAGGRGEREDYHAAAMLGLWEATFRWRPEAGASFATFSGYWMRMRTGRLSHLEAAGGLRVPHHHGRTHVRVTPLSNFRDEDDETIDVVPARVEESDPAAGLWEAVDRLVPTRRLRLVLWLYYRCGWSDPEIGAALGFTRARAQQLRTRTLARLRRHADRLKEFAA
jgi:RNA polymerase sigma factor (sigma-70 family)